ncbi:MAG: 16S rRNA (guanine(527)-N(7))-methyltransferase RsmG [Eubacterium sp.]|nr:16S rRNA (guanine(527)-N(7))-methyltransferase RsmG [Eubacterium sp.]
MKDLFSDYGMILSDEQERKLERYFELLVSYNEKVNLTSVTDRDEVWKTHFLDSALIFSPELKLGLDSDAKIRVLDVGTGAGFPGMVLAILKPEWDVVLLDSLRKRVDFLDEVVRELSLENVSCIQARAEELARSDDYREGFDLVVSRAVAELRLLLELCVPFAKSDGMFVSYKGPKFQEEISASQNALTELRCTEPGVHKISFFDKDRYLLEIRRVGELPEKYPRRPGIPAKRPL